MIWKIGGGELTQSRGCGTKTRIVQEPNSDHGTTLREGSIPSLVASNVNGANSVQQRIPRSPVR